jgi:hypothetical protein
MIRAHRRSLLFALALPLLSTAACNTISKAPEGSPRVEVELVVVVGDDFLGALEDTDQDSPLVDAIEQKALSMSDVGLRFYPVLSSEYGSGMDHPEYRLTLDVRQLDVLLDHKMIEEEGEEPRIETRVDRIACTVKAAFDRNIEGRPTLPAGRASATSEVRTSSSPAAPGYGVEGGTEEKPLVVSEADILLAVERAINTALKKLQEPIDREFTSSGL